MVTNNLTMMFFINKLLIFSIPFLFIITPVNSQYHDFYCQEKAGTYATNSSYQENINFVLANLTNKASLSLFDSHTIGQGMDQAYGMYMCRGDRNLQQCHGCVEEASVTIVQNCPIQKEAVVWYEQCMVRYANRSIFSRKDESYFSSSSSVSNISDIPRYGYMVSEAMDGPIAQAAYDKSRRGYAIGQTKVTLYKDVFFFVQCTPDILGARCERCLRVALRNMAALWGTSRIRLQMYLPSCWLRYDEEQVVGKIDSSSNSPTSSFNFPPLPNNPTVVPPGTSRATTMTFGGFSFMFGLVMTMTVSSSVAW